MIRLRVVVPADAWIFATLRREIQPDLTDEEHRAWWDTAGEHRWVAYDGPALVGVIRLTPREDGTAVVHLQVAKKEQGQGLGTQMLRAIQPRARELGFTALHATVDADNRASQGAFLGAEWRPTQFRCAL